MLDSIRDLLQGEDRPAVRIDRLTETFRLYHERPTGLKERLYRLRRTSYTDFHALEDVSLTVEHGECVAIIGHNGSGKSTLLKVLARILPPDSGTVELGGRVASLLELGAGFHGDLTGRENIYLNGAILGLTRAEIDERFDEIVEFAGVRPQLDTAVRTYSSGLYVRLGFAIAVTVDPDILLVDEVLSVGDAQFQARSIERMRAFRDSGKTVLIVSHDLEAVTSLCHRVVVLDRGRIAFDGPVDEGVALYRQQVATGGRVHTPTARARGSSVSIDEVRLVDGAGDEPREVAPSTPLVLRVRLRAVDDVDAAGLAVTFSRGDGTELYAVDTTWHGVAAGPLRPREAATIELRFTAHLLAGSYHVGLAVTDVGGRETLAAMPDAARFDVSPARGGAGMVDLQASASVSEGPALRLGDAYTTGKLPVVVVEDESA